MKKTLMIILGVLAFKAQCAQVKMVRNYEDIDVRASISEPNSVMIEGDRIQDIKAPSNSLLDTCNGKPNCKLIDEDSGVFTFLPTTAFQARTFSINLRTENGYFYNLRVEPQPIPSQTILLKTYKKTIVQAYEPRTSDYEKSMVEFLKILISEEAPEGFVKTKANPVKVYQSKHSRLKKLMTIRGNDLCGEVYVLTNTTKHPLEVKEAWFNWAGTKSVAITKTHLAPFDQTKLYRIS
jgi:conjugal transfer pilus assembly protein TraK